MSDLEVRAWSGHEGLRAALPDWRVVLAGSDVDPLCNDPDWNLAYAETYVPPAEVFGWTVFDGDAPVALLPLRAEPSRGVLSLRRALLLADGTFDSDYLDVPVLPGHEAGAVGALLDALAGERRLEALVLSGLPERSPVLAPLRRALEDRGLSRRERTVACLAAPLPDTYDGYVAGLKKRMRSKVRQARRAADEAGARMSWCEDPETRAADLEGLFELHGERWRAAGEEGSFLDTHRRAFYERFVAAHAAAGTLRLARFERDGQALAYQLGAVVRGTYYQIQEGFHPEEGDARPATALRAWAIERLIDEGVRAYDFLAGDSRHKRDWGGEPRPCTTLAFALPRWRARLAYGLRALLDRRT